MKKEELNASYSFNMTRKEREKLDIIADKLGYHYVSDLLRGFINFGYDIVGPDNKSVAAIILDDQKVIAMLPGGDVDTTEYAARMRVEKGTPHISGAKIELVSGGGKDKFNFMFESSAPHVEFKHSLTSNSNDTVKDE